VNRMTLLSMNLPTVKYNIIFWLCILCTACRQNRIENSCCQDSAFQFTYQGVLLAVPNAFTPNGDQINDRFGVKIIGAITHFNLKIKRGLKKVFESDDPLEWWDGKDGDSDPREDIYKYDLEIEFEDGKELRFDSHFCLIIEPAHICPDEAFSCIFSNQIQADGIINTLLNTGEEAFCQ